MYQRYYATCTETVYLRLVTAAMWPQNNRWGFEEGGGVGGSHSSPQPLPPGFGLAAAALLPECAEARRWKRSRAVDLQTDPQGDNTDRLAITRQ